MEQSELTVSRRAAKWMIGLGIFYGLAAMLLGCAAAFMFSESGHGGDWSGVAFVLGLLAGGAALYCLGLGIAVLVLQSSVRQGRRGAITPAGLVCWLSGLLPLLPVGLSAFGHSPGMREMLGIGLLVAVWVALHLRIVWLLRRAKSGL